MREEDQPTRAARAHGTLLRAIAPEAHRIPAFALLAIAVTSAASAQPTELDEGVRLYEQAELEAALAALDRAAEGRLERADVVRLLATRALVRFALGFFEPLERDLLAIATLEHDYELGMRAPPPLHAAYARLQGQIAGPLRVTVELEALEAGVRLHARTEGDAANIVEHVALSARRVGGEWQRGEDGNLVLPVLSGERVELYAEAIGPGNAVLASDGTANAPRTETVPPYRSEAAPPRGLSTGAKVGIVAASAAIVAAVVIIAILASGGSQSTRPQGPFVER